MAMKHRMGTPVMFEGLQNPTVPYDVFGFHEDFRDTVISSNTIAGGVGWTTTHVGGGAGADTDVTLLAEIGGGICIEVNAGTAADNDGINLNKDGAIFEADDDTDIVFETKFRIDGSGTAFDWLVGLCVPGQTAFLAASAALADVRNAIFMSQAGDASEIDANSTRLSGVTDTKDTSIGVLVDDTFITLRIVILGRRKVEWYINGVLVSSTTTNDAIPDGTLSPVLAVKVNGDEKPQMEIKYVDCWQTYKQAT